MSSTNFTVFIKFVINCGICKKKGVAYIITLKRIWYINNIRDQTSHLCMVCVYTTVYVYICQYLYNSLNLVSQIIEVTVPQCLYQCLPCTWPSLPSEPLLKDCCNNFLWIIMTCFLDTVNLTASLVIEKECPKHFVVCTNMPRDFESKKIW